MGNAEKIRIPQFMSPAHRFGFSLIAILFSACTQMPAQPDAPEQKDLDWVMNGAGLTVKTSNTLQTENLLTLMNVTPEMERFANEAVGREADPERRIHKLVAAMNGDEGLHLQYDAQATLTAEQAFQQRRVNCLSYAILFAALAREVGIRAQFNEVDIPPIWDIGDDQTVLLYKHVNIRVDYMFPLYQVVDVSGDDYDPSYAQRIIPDSAALAEYFNNRSVEMRMQQRYADALAYELQAVQMAPQIDYLWANLADLLSTEGSPKGARIAAKEAMHLNPDSMMDYNIAALVYQRQGDTQAATQYTERAHQFLEQSPYYHYQVALKALRSHDNKKANDEIERAIDLQPHEHRFYFLAAVIEEQLGNLQAANSDMQKALKLTRSVSQQQRYQNKFAQLAGAHG